jgi:hypothetical protein
MTELWTLGSSFGASDETVHSLAHAVFGLSGAEPRESTTSRRHVESEDDAVAALWRRSTGRPSATCSSARRGTGICRSDPESANSSSSFPATPAMRSIRAVFSRSRSIRESDG